VDCRISFPFHHKSTNLTLLATLVKQESDYGKQRLWASVGWGLTAPLAGALLQVRGVYMCVFVRVCVCFVCVCVCFVCVCLCECVCVCVCVGGWECCTRIFEIARLTMPTSWSSSLLTHCRMLFASRKQENTSHHLA